MLPKLKQISNEETIDLIKKYKKNKNINLRNRIVLGNLGLVYSVAYKYKGVSQHCGFEDFVSEGIIGMMEAINRFDVNKYKNFGTYAYWRILKSISDSVSFGTLDIPQHRISVYRKYEKIKKKMDDMGEFSDIETISKKIGISPKILADTINKKDDISLDYSLDEDFSIIDTVSFSNNFEEEIDNKIDFEKIKKTIEEVLSDNEKMVIKYRFGLDGADELTLKEVSKKIGVTSEYIRIIQNKSISKIQKAIK